jgi:hypothetical protein
VLLTPVANGKNLQSSSIVDTCCKPKVSTTYRNWWQNLPPVSLIPVANLPPVSLTPVVHLDLQISPRIFEKIRNDPNVISEAWGKVIHEKNLSKKSRDTVPLNLLFSAIVFSAILRYTKNKITCYLDHARAA